MKWLAGFVAWLLLALVDRIYARIERRQAAEQRAATEAENEAKRQLDRVRTAVGGLRDTLAADPTKIEYRD